MADDVTISYSYQPPAPQPLGSSGSGGTDKRLWAAASCNRVDLQNGGVLLLDRRGERQLVVAPEVSLALRSCEVFRSLPEHVAHLTSTIPQLSGQQADVGAVLAMLRDEGMLVSAESVFGRLVNDQAPAAARPAATRVFVITCDRPAAVQRLLESMLKNGQLSLHEQLILVDDSRNPENAAANRDAVRHFNHSSPLEMLYFGARDQERNLAALLSALPDHSEGIHFLLDRARWSGLPSYGRARTLCLLLSIGKRAIIMDDDVICSAVASPQLRDGLGFGDARREVDFYASEADIRARTRALDFDPLCGHARCLGLGMGQAIRELGFARAGEDILHTANAAYLSQWSPHSPILITQSGTVGDPGTPDTSWIYTVDPASARRLLATPGGLESALARRHYWMGLPRPTFSKMAVISQVTGLDNSQFLPPYFPVFRGEDYLFGAMVEYLHPDAATLEYPWSVPHLPLEPRPGDPGDADAFGRFVLNPAKYVTDRTLYQPGVSVHTRLGGLVLLLRELAEMSDQGLTTLYRTEIADLQVSRLKRLNSALQDGVERPPQWRAILEEGAARVSQAMQSVARPTRGDERQGPQDVLGEFRGYARGFALALESWPAIREAVARSWTTRSNPGTCAPDVHTRRPARRQPAWRCPWMGRDQQPRFFSGIVLGDRVPGGGRDPPARPGRRVFAATGWLSAASRRGRRRACAPGGQ